MFSQVFVCPQEGGCLPSEEQCLLFNNAIGSQTPSPAPFKAEPHPVRPSPPILSTGGQHACYQNEYFIIRVFQSNHILSLNSHQPSCLWQSGSYWRRGNIFASHRYGLSSTLDHMWDVFHPSQPMPGDFPLMVSFHPQKGLKFFRLEPSHKANWPITSFHRTFNWPIICTDIFTMLFWSLTPPAMPYTIKFIG